MLPVVPFQMARVGYTEIPTVIATTLACAIGCFVGAFLTDMPLIIAPPTSVSIFMAVSMQQRGMNYMQGNAVLILSGAMLAFIGIFPPLGIFLTRVSDLIFRYLDIAHTLLTSTSYRSFGVLITSDCGNIF